MSDSSSLLPPPSPSEDWQAVAPSFERILESARPFRPAIAALVDETNGRQHKQQLRDLLDALDRDASVDAVFDEGEDIDPLRLEALDWRPEKEPNTKQTSPFSLQEDSAAEANKAVWRTVGYPATLALGLLGFSFLMWHILVPEMNSVFDDFELPLPPLTELVLNARPFILAGMFLCVGILIGWMFLPALIPASLRRTIAFLLPWIGKIYRNQAYGKFCHVLSIMLGAGAPRDAAIRVASRATLPKFVARKMEGITRVNNLPKESAFASTFSKLSRAPQRLAFLLQSDIADSKRSGALRELAADYYFRSTDGSQAYFAPIVVFVAGLMVIFTIIGLFMPLVSLITNLSSPFT